MIINKIIDFSLSTKNYLFHLIIFLLFISGIYGLFNIKINNYLTDEVNKNSQMYQEVGFFDRYFMDKTYTLYNWKSNFKQKSVIRVEEDLIANNIKVDVSNLEMSNQVAKRLPIYSKLNSEYLLMCRMKDIG